MSQFFLLITTAEGDSKSLQRVNTIIPGAKVRWSTEFRSLAITLHGLRHLLSRATPFDASKGAQIYQYLSGKPWH